VPVETRPAVSPQAMETVKSTPIMEIPERRMSVVVGSDELDEAAVEAAVIAKINDITARLATETIHQDQMYLISWSGPSGCSRSYTGYRALSPFFYGAPVNCQELFGAFFERVL